MADQNAEKAIRALIEEHFPTHSILGEEFGHKVTDSPYQWILDPIDGTRNFISGIPLWGTLIGLTFEGKPVFGLNSQPHIGERFWGYGRACLYQGPRQTYGQLKTSQQTVLSSAIAATTGIEWFKSGNELKSYEIMRNEVQLMRLGCDCYAHCLLASGTIDIVLEAGLNSYDIAALIPIVEGASGIITNWQGEPLNFGIGGNGNGKIQVLACANKQLHAQALSLLNTI